MSGVGVMLRRSCWGGGVWENLLLHLEICPPPPPIEKTKEEGKVASLEN